MCMCVCEPVCQRQEGGSAWIGNKHGAWEKRFCIEQSCIDTLLQSTSYSWTDLNSLINLPLRPLNGKTNYFLTVVREQTLRIAPWFFCLRIFYFQSSPFPGWNRLVIIFFLITIQMEQKYPQSRQKFSWHNTFKAVVIICLVTSPVILSARESLCELLRPPFCLRLCLLLPMGKVVATSLNLTNVRFSHAFPWA